MISLELRMRLALKNLSHDERLKRLKSQGAKHQDAEDYLRYLFPPKEVVPEVFPAGHPQNNLQEAMDKLKKLAEASKNLPAPPRPELTVFNKHVIHNRHLLGGPSRTEGASYLNPGHYDTQALCWMRDVFSQDEAAMALLLGKPGTGKTWASLAYANSIATVQYTQPKLLGQDPSVVTSNVVYIKAYQMEGYTQNRKKHNDELNRLCNAPILIIDDQGSEGGLASYIGADFVKYFNHLIDERNDKYNRTTIINSNASWDAFVAAYGKRVESRFAQSGYMLTNSDQDFRLLPTKGPQ